MGLEARGAHESHHAKELKPRGAFPDAFEGFQRKALRRLFLYCVTKIGLMKDTGTSSPREAAPVFAVSRESGPQPFPKSVHGVMPT